MKTTVTVTATATQRWKTSVMIPRRFLNDLRMTAQTMMRMTMMRMTTRTPNLRKKMARHLVTRMRKRTRKKSLARMMKLTTMRRMKRTRMRMALSPLLTRFNKRRMVPRNGLLLPNPRAPSRMMMIAKRRRMKTKTVATKIVMVTRQPHKRRSVKRLNVLKQSARLTSVPWRKQNFLHWSRPNWKKRAFLNPWMTLSVCLWVLRTHRCCGSSTWPSRLLKLNLTRLVL
mmetsp:Transcript_17724/g.34918  ORF Transcript_17724/g.34918 Transcript_17724/m.34918 type:complete len:228 (-) Transcript_17724:880-1563(-)